MVSIVNGYLCRTSCGADVARKGRDPRNPTDNPVKADQLAIRDGKAVEGGRDEAGSLTRLPVLAVSASDRSAAAAGTGRFVDRTT